MAKKNLLDILEQLAIERPIATSTRKSYEYAINSLERHLGRKATASDLHPMLINGWLLELEKSIELETVAFYKRGLIALWNYAVSIEICRPFDPRRIRRIRKQPKIVVPWTVSEVTKLIEVAQTLPGKIHRRIPAAALLAAWVSVAYDTGLRPSDLRALQKSNVDLDRKTIWFVQSKTNRAHAVTISDESVQFLRTLSQYSPERVFDVNKSTFRRWELALLKKAGITRRKGQALGSLRKTHATQVAKEWGLEAAAASLGHVSGTAIARRHYVAPEALQRMYLPGRLSHDDAESRSNSTGSGDRASPVRSVG